MSEQPKPIDLGAIKGRLAQATPGPWKFDGDDRIVAKCVCVVLVTRGVDEAPTDDLGGPTFLANTEFIAHAPEDIAALLAEVERLRQENARLKEQP